MFKVSYTRVFGSNLSVVDITQHPPSKEGARNFDFKVVYPLYQGLNDDFFWTRKTSKTSQIKISVFPKTLGRNLYLWILTSPVVCKNGWNHRGLNRSVNHETRLKPRIADEPVFPWGVALCSKSQQLKIVTCRKSLRIKLGWNVCHSIWDLMTVNRFYPSINPNQPVINLSSSCHQSISTWH